MTCLAMLIGTAKPMPELEPVRLIICVFTPMTWPWRSRSGPPELPGFREASVCKTSGMEKGLLPLRMVRPTPLMMPLVMLNSCPKGLPRAAAT